MDNRIQNSQVQTLAADGGSGSNFLFGLGVVLLVCGAAITGHHQVTMIGLGLVLFSSLCEW